MAIPVTPATSSPLQQILIQPYISPKTAAIPQTNSFPASVSATSYYNSVHWCQTRFKQLSSLEISVLEVIISSVLEEFIDRSSPYFPRIFGCKRKHQQLKPHEFFV
ncbi:hypothetical protein Adt_19926 [Abeliophyllum distichum]|uniref:Uncharacterized protein n=1 Tax=Abeliophyllum distichum TaxID=126358 RepID=A0ABD1SUE4_9LAMI